MCITILCLSANFQSQIRWKQFYSEMRIKSFHFNSDNLLYNKKIPFTGEMSFTHKLAVIYRKWHIALLLNCVPCFYRETDFTGFPDSLEPSLANFDKGKLISEKFNYQFIDEVHQNGADLDINYLDDNYSFNLKSGLTFDFEKSGTLRKVLNRTFSREYKNGELQSITFANNNVDFRLKGNGKEINITEYNYGRGKENKTEISSTQTYINNELKGLKYFEDGKLVRSKEFDENGYLIKSYDYNGKGQTIISYFNKGVMYKREVKNIHETATYVNYKSVNRIDTTITLQQFSNGVLSKSTIVTKNNLNQPFEKLEILLSDSTQLNNINNIELLPKTVINVTNEKDGWLSEYTLKNGLLSGKMITYNKTNPNLISFLANYNSNGLLSGFSYKREFDDKGVLIWEYKGNYMDGRQVGLWETNTWFKNKKTTTKTTY